jgi:DNA-binding LytR/AlgR family response regulator
LIFQKEFDERLIFNPVIFTSHSTGQLQPSILANPCFYAGELLNLGKRTVRRMNCIVIDDDEMTRLVVEALVRNTPDLTLTGAYANPHEAVEAVSFGKPDLIFLDIEMPGMNGLDFLRHYGDSLPSVILITAHRKYAVEAFDFDVVDFLLKPVTEERFQKAVKKAREMEEFNKLRDAEPNSLYIKTAAQTIVKIDPKEILFIKSLSDYVVIHTGNEKHTTHATMKGMSAKLPGKDFFRIHHSYIVRIDKISQLENSAVRVGTHLLPVSRSNKRELTTRIKNLLGT